MKFKNIANMLCFLKQNWINCLDSINVSRYLIVYTLESGNFSKEIFINILIKVRE